MVISDHQRRAPNKIKSKATHMLIIFFLWINFNVVQCVPEQELQQVSELQLNPFGLFII